jgi:WD40 repeat protein
VLIIDPGMHTMKISRASADAEGRWAATGSGDKTVRVWSLADGALLSTIRLPAGSGHIGMVYAVAMSPDGAVVAAGGFTGPYDKPKSLYLFDRVSGTLVRGRHRSPRLLAGQPLSRRAAHVRRAAYLRPRQGLGRGRQGRGLPWRKLWCRVRT